MKQSDRSFNGNRKRGLESERGKLYLFPTSRKKPGHHGLHTVCISGVMFMWKDGITGGYSFAARAGDDETDVACVHDGVPALSSFKTVTVVRCSAIYRPV